MQNNYNRRNTVYIDGNIDGKPLFSYEAYGEKFYDMTVKIPRLSGNVDYLPVTISERLMMPEMQSSGRICALGQFRSYNKIINGKSKLFLTVFVRKILNEPISNNTNQIVLAGCLCKSPIYRRTPLNREIADILLAVNRNYGLSNYIPTIAWGRNARFASHLEVGDKIVISGRIQSREYEKATNNGIETRTAYEVSIASICAVNNDEEMNDMLEQHLENLRGRI